MKAYMLQDTRTGLYYRRCHKGRNEGVWNVWRAKEEANIWTSRIGPTLARRLIKSRRPCSVARPKIVTFNVEEVK